MADHFRVALGSNTDLDPVLLTSELQAAFGVTDGSVYLALMGDHAVVFGLEEKRDRATAAKVIASHRKPEGPRTRARRRVTEAVTVEDLRQVILEEFFPEAPRTAARGTATTDVPGVDQIRTPIDLIEDPDYDPYRTPYRQAPAPERED